jgi:hypothetical protein
VPIIILLSVFPVTSEQDWMESALRSCLVIYSLLGE